MNTKADVSIRERLTSPLTWHYVGFSILLLAVIVLATRFALDWAVVSTGNRDALANKQVELRALELQTSPLRGLDKRVDVTRGEIRKFDDSRIPSSYSSILTEIGDLQVKSGVRLSRVQYAQGATSNNLTEITVDAGVSGEYPQIMKFINSLERDKTFFLIRSMAFAGQQAGMVNLRLRFSTWLRPSDVPSGMARTGQTTSTSATQDGEQQP